MKSIEKGRKPRQTVEVPTVQDKPKTPRIGRKLGIIGSSVVVLGAALGTAILVSQDQNRPFEVPPLNRAIITAATEKLDAQIPDSENEREKSLINAYWFSPLSIDSLSQDHLRQEAANRIGTTLVFMSESENEYFRKAYDYYKFHYPQGLSIEGVEDIAWSTALRTSTLGVNEQGIVQLVEVDQDYLVYDSDLISTAVDLTHELTHAQNVRDRVETLGEKPSIEEIEFLLNTVLTRPDEVIAEEARGYSQQSRAVLEALALGFRRGLVTTDNLLILQAFIEGGQDPSSPYFANFIKNALLIPAGRI